MQTIKTQTFKQRKRKENLTGYMFAFPWLFGLIVFAAFPILASFYLSFTNYDMVGSPRWIGFTNYVILFTNDSLFYKSLGNTFYHVLISIPLMIIIGVGLAVLLNSKVKGISIYRTLFYLPNVVSIVAMSLLWLWLFQPSFGIVNAFLSPIYKLFNMEPLTWYLSKDTAKLTLIIMGLWNVGGSMVIYLAQMQDIPKSLYESADIDGAGWFRKLFQITIPLMTPSIFLRFITGLIGAFQVFTIAYIVTPGGSPGRSTYYYAYYLYDKMMSDNAMGMASAMAWILLVIILVITMIALRLNKYVVYLGDEQ